MLLMRSYSSLGMSAMLQLKSLDPTLYPRPLRETGDERNRQMTDANAVMTESAPQANQETLESMTPAERESWRLTGAMPKRESSAPPEKKAAPTKEASATSSEDVLEDEESVEEEPEAAAASEAAKPQKRTGTPAPLRVKELLAERKRDREEIAELRRLVNKSLETRATPESRTVPEKKDAAPAKKELRPEPQLDDKDPRTGKDKYEDYNSYIKDLRKWDSERYEMQLAEQRDAMLKEFDNRFDKRTKEQDAARSNQVIAQEWTKRVNEARKKYADYDSVAFPVDAAGNDTLNIPVGSVVDSFILESTYGTDVLYFLGQHTDELARIARLNPIAQARALLEIEQTFSKPSKKEKKVQQEQLEEEFEDEDEEEPEAPAKKVSSAPPPPREAAARGTRPLDEAKAAGARGDVAGYMRAMNAKELAAQRRRSS
jgi:hypothetical protein